MQQPALEPAAQDESCGAAGAPPSTRRIDEMSVEYGSRGLPSGVRKVKSDDKKTSMVCKYKCQLRRALHTMTRYNINQNVMFRRREDEINHIARSFTGHPKLDHQFQKLLVDLFEDTKRSRKMLMYRDGVGTSHFSSRKTALRPAPTRQTGNETILELG